MFLYISIHTHAHRLYPKLCLPGAEGTPGSMERPGFPTPTLPASAAGAGLGAADYRLCPAPLAQPGRRRARRARPSAVARRPLPARRRTAAPPLPGPVPGLEPGGVMNPKAVAFCRGRTSDLQHRASVTEAAPPPPALRIYVANKRRDGANVPPPASPARSPASP